MADYLEVARRTLGALPSPRDPKNHTDPDPAKVERATAVMNQAGVRAMRIDQRGVSWGGVEGGGAESAISGARHVLATGPHHCGNGPAW